jgi:hypothetical protein
MAGQHHGWRDDVAVEMTDFSRSYVTWSIPPDPNDHRKPGHMPWGNSARILIDARCTIHDDAAGTSDSFFLIAPCRTEWMYRDEEIVQNPNSEYRVIFSKERQLFVGKSMIESGPRPASTTIDVFTSFAITTETMPAVILETDEAVVAATIQHVPIGVQTELVNERSGLRAMLEYPVRTMNFHEERQRFQVDTGPLIFPDLESSERHLIDRCKLAHIVFNRFDYAEFVCKRPTPVIRNGETVASVFHYSEFHRMAVTNTILCQAERQ